MVDENGELVHALLLDGEGGARNLTAAEVRAWQPQQGIIWLHFDFTASATRDWLERSLNLPEIVVDALLSEETRPRSTVIDKGLLMSLRGVNLNPGANPEDMVSIRLSAEENRIVSTRRRRLLSVEDLAESLLAGTGPATTADLLIELCDRLVWRVNGTVDQFEDEVADLESRSLEQEDNDLRRDLATLRRQTIAVRRYLAPQREALNRLSMEKLRWINDAHRMQIREITDRLIRNIEDLDALRERAGVTQEELTNRIAEQMNNRMYVLSIVAAIFLPLGTLTGLLGINVGGIPGAEHPLGFPVFVILLVLIVAIEFVWFRHKKWF
jgi:zinc transporter